MMKFRNLRFGVSTLAVSAIMGTSVVGVSSAVSAESLLEALAAAYSSNPELDAQRASVRATDEGVRRAKSNFLPTISGTYTQTEGEQKNRQFRDGQEQLVQDENGNLVTADFQDRPRKIYGVNVDQNLFRGFQTYHAIKQAKEQINVSRAQLIDTEQRVLLSGVTAYMDVTRDEAVYNLNRNNIQVLERQLQASQDRFRVGEVTRTDVAQSEARLEGAKAQLLRSEADLAGSRAAYERVIGRPPATLDEPTLPENLPAELEGAITVGQEESPGVLNARYAEQAAKYAVREAKGALLPTATVRGNLNRFEGTNFFGTIRQENISETREVTFQVSVPLYTGGALHSDVRRAKQTRSQRLLEIRQAERIAQENVLVAWNNYKAAEGEILSRQAAVRANDIALEGVRQEAAVGSRTTLDVLDAEQELLDSRVNLVRAQRDESVAAYTLLSSMGQLTARKLALNVEYYDPEVNYKKIRNKIIGW